MLLPALAVMALGTAMGALALKARPAASGLKWLTRFVPAAGLGFVLGQGLSLASLPGALLAFVTVFFGIALVLGYRKRGPDRTPCSRCAERHLETACSGLQPIVRRERAFRRAAQRLIDRAELAQGARLAAVQRTFRS